MSSRYLIIHGHFYQPPRENPWILTIEPQDSATPFANWNLRINRECYAPNTKARLLAPDGSITKLINNYEYLSFNFGPTLLSWLDKADPETYGKIIEADRLTALKRDGHGPALAQVYNHIIMPLAHPDDRLTQIRWGLADFESRFGRRPEGMWLAETAVDLETLKMMAQEGLKFTILAQGQAQSIRPLLAAGSKPKTDLPWQDVSGGRIDPREPYRVFWGKGQNDYLDVFFYDGPVSRAIAFERLLGNGPAFLHRIEEAFGTPHPDKRPRLVNLATDGESYGHHFSFGEMALAWLFNDLNEKALEPEAIQLTNYGQYLALFPPVMEARIIENTSWSCAHGVERWRSDCGCNTGGGHGRWNQKWRKPLRQGLDWLRDQLAKNFTAQTCPLLKDPLAARNDYIRIIISGYDLEIQDSFLKDHQARPLSEIERRSVLTLMESQLMSLYMFTSCAWFFDDLAGLEPVQNLRYALRAIELAQPGTTVDLTEGLLNFLKMAQPNAKEYETGEDIWRDKVESDRLSLPALAAHWAASVIVDAPALMDFFVMPNFTNIKLNLLRGEGVTIAAGAVDITDRRQAQTQCCLYLAIYSGNTYLAILAEEMSPDQEAPFWLMPDDLHKVFGGPLSSSAALDLWGKLIGLMPQGSRFVMESLMPHCRRLLLSSLVEELYDGVKHHILDVFHRNQHLLMINRDSGQNPAWMERFIFRVAGEAELKRILAPADLGRPVNLAALNALLSKRGLVALAKQEPVLAETGKKFLDKIFNSLRQSEYPHLSTLLTELIGFIKLIREEGFELDFWNAQNHWMTLREDQAFMGRLTSEEKEHLANLGISLGFNPNFEGGLGS